MQDNGSKNKTGFDAEWPKVASGLPRVEAPQYFEANVRSRIETRKTSGKSGSLSFLKLALPVASLGALALFFFVSGYMTSEITPLAVVNENSTYQTLNATDVPVPPESDQVVNTSEKASSLPAEVPGKDSAVASAQTERSSPGSRIRNLRTIDHGVNPAEREIAPRGLDTNPQLPGSNSDPDGEKKVRVVDILQFAGVQTALQQGRLVVSSVAANSPSSRVGIQAGDVLEAVNDLPLNQATTLPGGVDIRTIRVRRGEQLITLKF